MKKILVANRGEIAIRVMQSAKEMGIRTVAVYSQADRLAQHVQYADEAICIGPPSSSASYLHIPAILEACALSGADAVHPGYGFLSENPDFAAAVSAAGLTFIGPNAESMRIMGNKISAKQLAKVQNIPLVPGTDVPIEDAPLALKEAQNIGFPILVKAAAGGGGKGMRVVYEAADFEEQLGLAISEARSAFGDGSVFLERYIEAPRHIEIQVIADQAGNTLHVFERECSIQRRHQKVIEEAPSVLLSESLRKEMGDCATRLAVACGYVGVGTVEFILDEQQNYYFLEMNTRLQVEHPVTEMISGLDLVKEQIRIARGQHLSFKQEDLKIHGHALELRIYAEDPQAGFLPDTGILTQYELPHGPGVRVDNGYKAGMEIPVYYDPMIAKLCVWGKNREEAIQRMRNAIKTYRINGIKSTLDFGLFVMEHPQFIEGNFDTRFVDLYFKPEQDTPTPDDDRSMIAALVGSYLLKTNVSLSNGSRSSCTDSNWKRNRNT